LTFLFVEKPVFDRCLDSNILQALHARFHCNSGEVRIWGEALPVTPAIWGPAQWASNRTASDNVSRPAPERIQSSNIRQGNLSAFPSILETQIMIPLVNKISIPGGSNCYSGREHAHIIRRPYSIWAILETEACEIQTRNGPNIPDTWPGHTGDEPCLFIEREQRDEMGCLVQCCFPPT
jgi:hypothetical protein